MSNASQINENSLARHARHDWHGHPLERHLPFEIVVFGDAKEENIICQAARKPSYWEMKILKIYFDCWASKKPTY